VTVLAWGMAGDIAQAQVQNITGSIAIGKNGGGIRAAFEASWNQGDFSCAAAGFEGSGPPFLVVTCNAGACVGRSIRLRFRVVSGGAGCTAGNTPPCTSAGHTFNYTVNGSSGQILQTLGFDGQPPIAINNGTFVFNLAGALEGGDVIEVQSEQLPNVSMLDRFMLPLLALALLLAGSAVLIFRNRAAPRPA
jgi:hypothetical protein